MTPEPITVIIVDDHPVMRSGLRRLIEADPAFRVTGEADNGEAALALMEGQRPAVALMDIAMPRMTGLEAARVAQDRGLPTRIAVLTMSSDEVTFNELMDRGVLGYILKENAASEIVNCIRTVARGDYYISPSISGVLLKRKQRQETALRTVPGLADLTPAELRILRLVAGNKTSKEIGVDLCISTKTVENHRASIARKLQLSGNHALLRFALEHRSLL